MSLTTTDRRLSHYDAPNSYGWTILVRRHGRGCIGYTACSSWSCSGCMHANPQSVAMGVRLDETAHEARVRGSR